jgi:hypothetical protein
VTKPDSPSTPSKSSRGAPNGNHNRLKHGVHAVTKLVKTLGTDRALDKRTAMGKALERWRRELIDDLGGDENISAQQRAIIDLAVKNKLILDSIDRWIFQQASLIDKRKRALLPVVRERQSIANALAEYMDRLGLERQHKVKTISDLLNGHDEAESNGKAD